MHVTREIRGSGIQVAKLMQTWVKKHSQIWNKTLSTRVIFDFIYPAVLNINLLLT
jgi:hypothetical protein